eukprot:5932260-Alexandrium_andersonii.AAC.1
MDPGVLRALRGQWCEQVRWASLGGEVSQQAIRGTKGLPQGDPWGPVGLLAVMAGPSMRCLLYTSDAADDM